ncbi:polysaccharide deacetylase family protein [Dactylosporangium sp. NPDC000521]|uniref:polysaccharide deacetylase family protein n=1 Tax=Dactylosporangium sp. NPDC000521 TaxID=3363975 RepID=UPI0036B0EDA1
MPRLRSVVTLLVASMLALTACGPDKKQDHQAARPATGAPSPTASADPSPTAEASPSAGPSASKSPAGKPSPKASASTVQGPEGTFVIRPPGTGHGAAGSQSRTGTTAVALTFDDGPDPVNTPKILDLLRDNGVKATFCLVGFRARDNPALVRRIADEGHTLCNHSWQHLTNLAKKDPGYIDWDLKRTNEAIRAAAPGVPIRYFRAPGGNFTPGLIAKAKDLGMASIYWDVDPADWNHTKDADDAAHIRRVIAEVKQHVRQGSIVLSHDNKQPDTIIAYQTLLPLLKRYFTLEAL